MWKVVRKTKLLKPCLKKLNTQYFRNIVTEASEDKDALKVVQEKLQTDPLNTTLQEEEKVKYEKYRPTSYMAESFLQQQSKVTWLKLGDDCTRYFFAVIKHKGLQQAVTQVKDDQHDICVAVNNEKRCIMGPMDTWGVYEREPRHLGA